MHCIYGCNVHEKFHFIQKKFMMNKVFWHVEWISRCINLHLSDDPEQVVDRIFRNLIQNLNRPILSG